MTEPFDWADLSHEAASIRYIHGNLAAAAYLRERIEAAFVPRIGAQKVIDFGAEQAARAEAAEARVRALGEALQRIDDLDSKDEGDMPMMEAAAWNGALEVCRTIAFKALGGEHDK